VFAALDPDWCSRLLSDLKVQVPGSATVTEMDGNGAILARYPPREAGKSQPVPDPALVKAVHSDSLGSIEARGSKGVLSYAVAQHLRHPRFGPPGGAHGPGLTGGLAGASRAAVHPHAKDFPGGPQEPFSCAIVPSPYTRAQCVRALSRARPFLRGPGTAHRLPPMPSDTMIVPFTPRPCRTASSSSLAGSRGGSAGC